MKQEFVKLYREISPRDEFNAFVSNQMQRVRCVYPPRIYENAVCISVSPVYGHLKHTSRVHELKFSANHQVEIYPSKARHKEDVLQAYEACYLDLIPEGSGLYSFEALSGVLQQKFGTVDPNLMRIAINRLSTGSVRKFRRMGKGENSLYRRLSPDEGGGSKWENVIDRYKHMVMELLAGSGGRRYHVRDIIALAACQNLHLNRGYTTVACEQLVEAGVLYLRRGETGLAVYRTAIDLQPGLYIVEHLNQASMRAGWVLKMQDTKRGEVLPLVRFVDGYERLSSQALLDLCTSSAHRDQIDRAKEIYEGKVPASFKPIPFYIFCEPVTPSGRVRALRIKEIGEYLGIWDNSQYNASYNITVDYLNFYYPNWRHNDSTCIVRDDYAAGA